jgi:MoaD family protein
VKISIRYFTTLREITGKKEETITFTEKQEPTVSSTLKTLSTKYGKSFTDYIFDPKGQVKNFLQLLINGVNIPNDNKLESTLQNGDILIILPPVSGG